MFCLILRNYFVSFQGWDLEFLKHGKYSVLLEIEIANKTKPMNEKEFIGGLTTRTYTTKLEAKTSRGIERFLHHLPVNNLYLIKKKTKQTLEHWSWLEV